MIFENVGRQFFNCFADAPVRKSGLPYPFRGISKNLIMAVRSITSKRERTRLHILKSAAKQFARYGYEGIGMESLARSMKLTKGALYGHFKSKQDLFIQSVIWYIDQAIQQRFDEGFEEGDSRAQLVAYLDWLLGAMEKDLVLRQLLNRLLIEADTKTAKMIADRVFVKPFKILVNLLQDYRPDIDAVEYAYSLFSIAIVSQDIKKISRVLSPKHKASQNKDMLLRHFMDIINSSLV